MPVTSRWPILRGAYLASPWSRRTSTACISAPAARGVLEYHGNILRDRCTVEQIVADRSEDTRTGLPRCAACGGLLRPDVVWFGESIPVGPMTLAAAAAEDCDVFLSVGTSSLVYPAAGLAEVALRQARDRHRDQSE